MLFHIKIHILHVKNPDHWLVVMKYFLSSAILSSFEGHFTPLKWHHSVSGEEDGALCSIPNRQSVLEHSAHESLRCPQHCMTMVASCTTRLNSSSIFSYQPFLPYSGTMSFPIFSQAPQQCHQIAIPQTGRVVKPWQENKE